MNALDSIEEFRYQEKYFISKGLQRKRDKVIEPVCTYDVDGVRYALKWYVFTPEDNSEGGGERSPWMECSPCPLYLFIGNIMQPGYAYVQVLDIRGLAGGREGHLFP